MGLESGGGYAGPRFGRILVQGQLKSLTCQVDLVLWTVGATGSEVPMGHRHSSILEKACKLGWEAGVVI